MKIGREEWQEELKKIIRTSLPRLKQIGITSGYTIIAASAVLPLLTAGTQWLSVLASLVGSIGANLISNLVQGAKDDIELAKRIQSLPPDDTVHQYMQLLLEKIDAVNVVRQGLPESDWARLAQLLDSRLIHIQSRITERIIEAPIIHERISSVQARIISRTLFRKTWWLKKGQNKLELRLEYWPLAYYKTFYVVKYREKKQEQKKNEQGEIIGTEERIMDGTTVPIEVGIVVYPDTIITRGSNELQHRVFAGINNFKSDKEIQWGQNAFVRFIYESFYFPLWKSFRSLLKSPKIKVAEKKLSYLKNYTGYEVKAGYLSITEDQLIAQARLLTQQELAYYYNNLSNTTFLGAEYGQESIRCIQYPFWIVEAKSPFTCDLVIDGLTGKVLFTKAFANLFLQALIVCSFLFIISIIVLIFVYLFTPLLR